MSEQRRLAAIVSADVAGYSRLMGRDESGTLDELKAVRREVVDPRIAKHNGRIVKTTGDGLLLEFASVVDAVRCVIDVQTAMAEETANVPEDRRIAFRIGVHVGDIIIDDGDIFGDGVNVVARLQGIASPGGLCISDRAHDDIRDRLDASFAEMGAQTLKNIARPIPVWSWSPNGMPAASASPPALALPDKPSIAVLRFQNMPGSSGRSCQRIATRDRNGEFIRAAVGGEPDDRSRSYPWNGLAESRSSNGAFVVIEVA